MNGEQLEKDLAKANKACRLFTNRRSLDFLKKLQDEDGDAISKVENSKTSFQLKRSLFRSCEEKREIGCKFAKFLRLSDEESFAEKFEEAVSGDGNEIRRINRLGSSSLLALLFFYRVSKDHVLKLTLNDRNDRECVFDEVHFECKNPIMEGSRKCSNMDVLLLGRDSSNKSVALFLECKFSEYLNRSRAVKGISPVYKGIYEEFFECGWDLLEFDSKDGTVSLKMKDSGMPSYCHGIKQMISHCMGLRYLCSKKSRETSSKGEKVSLADKDIFLGEILFNGFCDTDYFGCYEKLYKDFAGHVPDKEKFTVLNELLTYQKVVAYGKNKDSIDGNVCKLYSLD